MVSPPNLTTGPLPPPDPLNASGGDLLSAPGLKVESATTLPEDVDELEALEDISEFEGKRFRLPRCGCDCWWWPWCWWGWAGGIFIAMDTP